MSIEMIAYDPVQGQVCWLTLREGFSNPTAAFGPGLAEYRPPPKTADSPWLPPTTSEALPIRAVAEPQEPKKRDQEARGTDTCLELPTWKTDQSSRVKTIEPTFGWLGNPPGGPKCRRTPQRVAPLGGFPFVNTRISVFHLESVDYPDGLLRGLRGRAGRPGTSIASSRYASRTEIS